MAGHAKAMLRELEEKRRGVPIPVSKRIVPVAANDAPAVSAPKPTPPPADPSAPEILKDWESRPDELPFALVQLLGHGVLRKYSPKQLRAVELAAWARQIEQTIDPLRRQVARLDGAVREVELRFPPDKELPPGSSILKPFFVARRKKRLEKISELEGQIADLGASRAIIRSVFVAEGLEEVELPFIWAGDEPRKLGGVGWDAAYEMVWFSARTYPGAGGLEPGNFWIGFFLMFNPTKLLANLGKAGLTKAAVSVPRTTSGPRLVHMSEASGAIRGSGRLGLPSDLYAGPAANAKLSGWPLTARTGLSPGGNFKPIFIPQAAEGAFARPVPVGIVTGWQRVTGQQYAARGIIDLGTGQFTRTGVNRTQALWYTIDVGILDPLMVGGTVGGVYRYTTGGDE